MPLNMVVYEQVRENNTSQLKRGKTRLCGSFQVVSKPSYVPFGLFASSEALAEALYGSEYNTRLETELYLLTEI